MLHSDLLLLSCQSSLLLIIISLAKTLRVNVDNDKLLNQLFKSQASLLKIKVNSSFAQTLKKIFKSKKADFIWVQKPKTAQMLSVLLARLSSKKFLWIQSFQNPPQPDFVTRILLNQADEIIVKSKIMAAKLKSLGVEKPKIKLLK